MVGLFLFLDVNARVTADVVSLKQTNEARLVDNRFAKGRHLYSHWHVCVHDPACDNQLSIVLPFHVSDQHSESRFLCLTHLTFLFLSKTFFFVHSPSDHFFSPPSDCFLVLCHS